MSLILEALKKAQRERMERKAKRSSTLLPWFSQRETKRFFRPKFLFLILTPLLISISLLIASLPRTPQSPLLPFSRSAQQGGQHGVQGLPYPVTSTSTETFPILKEISVDSIADHSASMREAVSAPPPKTEVERIEPPPQKIEQPKKLPPKKAKVVPKPAPKRIEPPQPEVEKAQKEVHPVRKDGALTPPKMARLSNGAKVFSKPVSEPVPAVPQEKVEARPASQSEAGGKQLSIQTIPAGEATHHFNLGLLYHKNHKLSEALEQYKKAIQIDPFNVGAHNNLGMAYKDLGRYEEAISQYQKALSIDPKYDKARHNLAVAYYSQGNLEKAALEFSQAIESNPKMAESYNNLGLLYRKQKKLSEAKRVFQKGLSIVPNFAPLHYNLAITLEEEGDLQGAIFRYQKFVELSAEDQKVLIAKVKRHLESLSHGR